MASDRTRELAEKWLEKHGQKNSNIQVLAELLDAFERETASKEAGWWNQGEHPFYCERSPDCLKCKRIAALAAQPTPEVKK